MIIIAGTDEVASISFGDEFGYGASCKQRYIIAMRLNGCQDFTYVGLAFLSSLYHHLFVR